MIQETNMEVSGKHKPGTNGSGCLLGSESCVIPTKYYSGGRQYIFADTRDDTPKRSNGRYNFIEWYHFFLSLLLVLVYCLIIIITSLFTY